MMNTQKRFVDVFVRRPILAVVLSLLLLLLGLRAGVELPISQYPQVESSSLVVTTTYVGASAEVVEGFISAPIERVAMTLPGVDYVDAKTVEGLSTVTAWMKLNEDSSTALAELASRLDQIKYELPQGAEDPVVNVVRADRPAAVFYLDVVTDHYSRAEVTDYLTRYVNPSLASIEGVQRIGLEGGRKPAMRVWLDPSKMLAFNISAEDINSALQRNNVISTLGQSKNQQRRINILANTTLTSAREFEQMVIREHENALVRLADVATVELGEEEGALNARQTQSDAVYISVWPLPGANELAIGNALYDQIEEINQTLPSGLEIRIGFDGTLFMRDAINEIFITLVETILLVGVVVLLLMGSFRTAVVPLITIPISICGAVAAMYLMGFSLNLLTILAIVLSVGLVVDDAIVMVENVSRYMSQGVPRMQAALMSARQLLNPIIAMTITLAVVYAPIGFLSGLTGVLFKEFAFTLSISVIISGLVALTLSPVLSAYVCAPGGKESYLTLRVNRLFARLTNRYSKMLNVVFKWDVQILFGGVIIALLVVPFYMFSHKELAPIEDQSSINIIFEAAGDSSLEYTTDYMQDVTASMMQVPGAKSMWQLIGPGGGFGGIEFVDFADRDMAVQDMLEDIYISASQVTGLTVFPVLFPALPTAGNFDVELVVQSGDSREEMLEYVHKMIGAAYQSGQFLFVDTDLKIDLPQVELKLNRERIADLGMDIADVSQQLGVLMSGDHVNHFELAGKAYRVIPMIEGHARQSPESLLALHLRAPSGELIPVSMIADIEHVVAPRALGKFQQQNAFRIFAGLVPGTTKEQGLATLEEAAKGLLPETYSIDYAGESRQLRQEGNTLFGVLLLALLFVYFVLSVQFNSFRDPLIVLIGSVPLALSGAMLFPFLGLTTINIYSQIGLITLVGLIAKNAILIIEFANQLQRAGKAKADAIVEAANTRLRPVLMTTAATVLGHFPLVLVSGPGAEARNSIGIILVFGMLIGTIFTLFVLPCVYRRLAENHHAAEDAEFGGTEKTQGLASA
uniref:Acriflavine resistance protein B n=2 Tax=Pseudoalteromonas rubra TaxID=43658 RepID=A0A0F4QUX9_9GAMM|nr:efflux RND transporter permease subunit [Pseudoalteromonas rubra]KJZ11144.1 acriflavine resistance protein B [Pseudoalteromonas rubra]